MVELEVRVKVDAFSYGLCNVRNQRVFLLLELKDIFSFFFLLENANVYAWFGVLENLFLVVGCVLV